MHYGELYTGPVLKYSTPFTLVTCGDLSPSQVEQTRQAIKSAWLSARPDLKECQCFDITIIAMDKFTDSYPNQSQQQQQQSTDASSPSSRISTQLTYLGLAKDQVLEVSNTTPENSPSVTSIFEALAPLGLSQCFVRNGRSTLLDVVVANPSLAQPEFDALERFVKKYYLFLAFI